MFLLIDPDYGMRISQTRTWAESVRIDHDDIVGVHHRKTQALYLSDRIVRYQNLLIDKNRLHYKIIDFDQSKIFRHLRTSKMDGMNESSYINSICFTTN